MSCFRAHASRAPRWVVPACLRRLGVHLAFVFALLLTTLTAHADEWDVTVPRGDTRQIAFTVTEGTGMSVDISPDGRWLLFDLLSHVYRVPVAGGKAQVLTQDSGIALNYQPRYSPDGRSVVFVSDRGGQSNLWLMDADGSRPRPLHIDQRSPVTEPVWTPDGKAVIAVKLLPHAFGGWTRSNRLWRFPLDGSAPEEVVGSPDSIVGAPSVSADGRHLYYHRSSQPVVAEGFFKVGTDHQIRRRDLVTGADEVVLQTAGRRYYHQEPLSPFAPSVSPDGRWLAFARRVPGASTEHDGMVYSQATGLWLRDLRDGSERLLVEHMSLDQLETHTMYQIRLLPGYAWASDSRSLVYSAEGGLRRVQVQDGAIASIPFSAKVDRTISEQVRPRLRLEDGPYQVRFPRWPTLSPDGGTLVFEAVGALWRKPLPNGVPQRLLPDAGPDQQGTYRFEATPAWSPDGKWIAYATWKDGEGGHLWVGPSDGGAARRLTSTPGEYLLPSWRADGRELVAVRGAGASFRGDAIGNNPTFALVRVGLDGGEPREVVRLANNAQQPPRPTYGGDGRIYYAAALDAAVAPEELQRLRAAGMGTGLYSIDADGNGRQLHAGFPFALEALPSPDGRWVALQQMQQVYVAELPAAGQPVPAIRPSEAKRVGEMGGGLYPAWSADGRLGYLLGSAFVHGMPGTGTSDRVDIGLAINQERPQRLALTNARILTMDDAGVIARGTVLVEGRRIVAVGADIAIPENTHVVDLAGATLMPGLIDVHAHHFGGGPFGGPDWGIMPQRRVESANYLAYGVTTVFDPAAPAMDVFPVAELTATGRVLGPRVFTTAEPVVGAGDSAVDSLADADAHVARLRAWGALGAKQYYQPSRTQRQWLTEATRKVGDTLLTGEGMDFAYNLGMIMDGQTAWEHPILDIPLYDDVVQFVARSGVVYNPELITPGQGRYILEHYLGTSDLPNDAKQRNWVPWQWLARKRSYSTRPLSEYPVTLSAAAAGDIVRAGGRVGVGGHGQEQGLGTHWEMWTLGLSMTPQQVLEAATIANARFLGLERDLGSIVPGKIADLLVLGADPLADLRNTTNLRQVIREGRVYEAQTLDQQWPLQQPYGPRRWRQPAVVAP